jgi:hypothetical protein
MGVVSDESIETVQKQKKIWNYIRNIKKDSSGVAPLRSDGLLVDDTKEKAEIVNRQYFSVFTPENTDEHLLGTFPLFLRSVLHLLDASLLELHLL